MEFTQEHYDRIEHLLPKQRGNAEIENLTFFRSLQSMAENGCRWRAIVECYFRNIKQFRRVFTRYDKLDETYNAFITIANVCIFLRNLV